MDLGLSEDQKILQTGARRFFSEQMPMERVRSILDSPTALDTELWLALANLGWLGVIIPEEYGGSGFSFMDLVILLEEMGRARVPSPYFSTVALGALAIVDWGSEEQKRSFLPGIAAGKSVFSLALVEGEGSYDQASIRTTARRSDRSYALNGVKLFVPFGLAANSLICVAREGGDNQDPVSAFILDANQNGVGRTQMKTLTNEFYAEVSLDGAVVGDERRLPLATDGWSAIQQVMLKAAVARCAFALGGAEHVLEITVQYAKDRVQFGQPIGKFQAIQHHCADMVTAVDACRLMTYSAASKVAAGLPFELEAAMAKSWCGEAYEEITHLGHQVHGGVGLIVEHPLHLYTRDARSTESMLGNTDHHLDLVAGFLEKLDTLM